MLISERSYDLIINCSPGVMCVNTCYPIDVIGEVVDLSESGAYLEEVMCSEAWDIEDYSLTLLLALFVRLCFLFHRDVWSGES